MPFNGSGVFTRLYNWANDAAASVKIRADRFDAEMDGFATGLSTCMTKDGQQLPTAAQNFNGQNLTNVGAFSTTGTNTFSGTTTVFSASAARIQGDFSNATLASRSAFQTSTTNGTTGVYALPNGTATSAGLNAFNNSDPTNASYVGIDCNASVSRIVCSYTGSGSAQPLSFIVGSGSPEVARFDTSGNWLVGRTSLTTYASGVKGISAGSDGRLILENDYSVGNGITQNIFNAGANNVNNVYFYRNSIASGVIVTNSSAQTSYAASSDYRLKNDPQPLTGSGAFIDALHPKTWTWETNGQRGVGFIAHEVAAVSPSSVFGDKDALNDDGTPKYQSMEYGSPEFIANIIAELQSLRARVAALEAA
jgi:Chaperone of endosialidase